MGHALPVKTNYEMTENVKIYTDLESPNHKNKTCILSRLKKMKISPGRINSLKSETDDGLSSCSNFPERATKEELEMNKPILPETEQVRRKLTDEQLKAIKKVLDRNQDVFLGLRWNFVEQEIELEELAVPHRERARRMISNKPHACRK